MNGDNRMPAELPERHFLVATFLVAIGLILRVIAIAMAPDELTIDRDAYLGIAAQVRSGIGFCTPGSTAPTAFRPPLYPLLIAAGTLVVSPAVAVGLVNLFASAGAIVFTYLCGLRMGLGPGSVVAAALVACDPLLVVYTRQPMTEVVCAALVALNLWLSLFVLQSSRAIVWTAWGLVAGLIVLCRPAFLPILFGVGLILLWSHLRKHGVRSSALVGPILAVAAAGVPIGSWGARNAIVLGTPIFATTHGGYTLCLANNSTFYDEVAAPTGTANWPGPSLDAWQKSLQRQVNAATSPNFGEVAQDRELTRVGWQWIVGHPAQFVHLSLLRLTWLFAPGGDGTSSGSLSRTVLFVFYAAWWFAAVIGWVRPLVQRSSAAGDTAQCSSFRGILSILSLSVLGLVLVHSVYWTNARMRAPIVPALAILAGLAVAPSKPAASA